ncbi:hypothetical protein SLEP1_g22560 [Rubroshorea leprosula]|uniref:Uncharacterized protein n=1 Tax=Rubroshorea leprosula TaxID=152421 RepID=A0AAV5JKH3_9ROSI|nr:hypothetical protein SLEP1_g22560 [Rubroshorea leprosula]
MTVSETKQAEAEKRSFWADFTKKNQQQPAAEGEEAGQIRRLFCKREKFKVLDLFLGKRETKNHQVLLPICRWGRWKMAGFTSAAAGRKNRADAEMAGRRKERKEKGKRDEKLGGLAVVCVHEERGEPRELAIFVKAGSPIACP